MLWVAIALMMLTVPLFYPFYGIVASFMGIANPVSLFFFLAIIGICLLCLQFSLALSSAFGHRKGVIQKVALLEERLALLEGELQREREAKS